MKKLKINIENINDNIDFLNDLQSMLNVQSKREDIYFAKYIVNLLLLRIYKKAHFFNSPYKVTINECEGKAIYLLQKYVPYIESHLLIFLISDIHQKLIS